MPLIGADMVLHSLNTFRSIWVRGRYGGGKTFISFLLAEQMQKRYGYSIYSNVDNEFQADEKPDEHAVIVYDEAWLTLGLGTSPKEIKKYLAFLRKRDYILVMPSVLPLAKGGWLLWVERSFNLGALGIPIWVYNWGIAGKSAKDSGILASTPPPSVRFRGFGDSALDFQVRGFIQEPVLHGRAVDRVCTAVYKALNEAEIEIPYPQRVVHMQSNG